MKKQDNNNNALHSHHNNDSNQKKIVIGSSQEIADMMMEETEKKERKELLEPGSHNLLIYDDLKKFREIYSLCSRALLSENEIVLIGTQYDAIEEARNALRLAGIDVQNHLNQGTLFIIDAQQGYQRIDSKDIWKLGMSLLTRAKKEGRRGVTLFSDPGSFFNFGKMEELMQYELWLPQKYEDVKLKKVCCYHFQDFGRLTETQQHALIDHHFKSILIL